MRMALYLGVNNMTKQDDVHGWGSTEWGMTEAEILQLLQSDAKRLNPPIEYRNPTRFSTVGIPDKAIGGRSCAIHFLFDKTSGLNEVMIKPNDEKPYGYFESFLELLTQKYGPATKSNKEDMTDTVVWLFPSTTVELTKIDASVLDMLLVTVRYCSTASRDLSFL
jgi:hypothetical protein